MNIKPSPNSRPKIGHLRSDFPFEFFDFVKAFQGRIEEQEKPFPPMTLAQLFWNKIGKEQKYLFEHCPSYLDALEAFLVIVDLYCNGQLCLEYKCQGETLEYQITGIIRDDPDCTFWSPGGLFKQKEWEWDRAWHFTNLIDGIYKAGYRNDC